MVAKLTLEICGSCAIAYVLWELAKRCVVSRDADKDERQYAHSVFATGLDECGRPEGTWRGIWWGTVGSSRATTVILK